MKPIALLLFWVSFAIAALPPPVIQWQRAFGTIYDDQGTIVVKQTADGGYIVGASQGDVHDTGQYWLLRLDPAGNVLWQRTGGSSYPSGEDGVTDVEPTSDGGFIVLTRTGDNPVFGGDTNMTDGTFGSEDIWVHRFDANGNRLWNRTLGTSGDDEGAQVMQTPDGGFWIFGNFESGTGGNRTSTNFGLSSWWFVRLDTNGQKVAEHSYGGSGAQKAGRFAATADGGFVLVGSSTSSASGNKTSPKHGSLDVWVVRVDASGNMLWDRSFGRAGTDFALNVWETNGMIIVGASSYFAYTNSDFWVLGLDQQGATLWQRVAPASDMPFGVWCITPATAGGYVLGGTDYTLIYPDPEEPQYSEQEKNFRVARTDANGQRLWQFSMGGIDDDDNIVTILPTRDGGWLVAGESNSGVGGSKTYPNFGFTDFWIVKLAPDALHAPPIMRAVLQNSTALATNGFRFTLSGVSNADYIVERSLDFSSWLPLATNRLNSNPVPFIDLRATNISRAFYRARPSY